MILYRRSHFVPTAGYEQMEDRIRDWWTHQRDAMPGFSEIVRAFVIDDVSRGFVTLECTSEEGFLDGGCDALREFTERVVAGVDGPVEYHDNYDVLEHAAPNSDITGTPAGNLYRSSWFTSDAPDEIVKDVERWHQEEASDLQGYSRSWLIRGISEGSVLALSVEWGSDHALREVAPPATDALFDRVKSSLSSEPETYNVRSGGKLEGAAVHD